MTLKMKMKLKLLMKVNVVKILLKHFLILKKKMNIKYIVLIIVFIKILMVKKMNFIGLDVIIKNVRGNGFIMIA